MKKTYQLMALVALIPMILIAQTERGTTQTKTSVPMPQIKRNGGVRQMFVDGKPFIMLSGELHNSSASSIEYMKPIWDKLAAMHLNSVVTTENWELVEPEEVFMAWHYSKRPRMNSFLSDLILHQAFQLTPRNQLKSP
jgi:hypothetical protein